MNASTPGPVTTAAVDAAAAEIRRLGWSLRQRGTTVDHLPSVFTSSLRRGDRPPACNSSRTLCGKVVEQVTMPVALRPCRLCARVHHAAVARRARDLQREASRPTRELTRHAFARRLLTLWSEANDSRDVAFLKDFTAWSGASKDLLIDLQATWDGHRYVLPPPPKVATGA